MQILSKQTDDELVQAYSQGDNKAFDTLLQRHQSRLFSYIMQIVKNRDFADDIFQETFVKAIMTIRQGKYTETGKFSSWLTRIAHNLIIDFYRQGKAQNTVSTDDDTVDLLNRKDLCDSTIEDFIISDDISDDVRRLVKSLPDSQREVLEMRFYRNMSFKEIADLTNVSINTALGRMRYAILNMRRIAKEKNIVLSV
ncbi:MAG: sigma-70 family RNA polymerase sigma factor [Muribaculaceae bacterium]|nr:sigma-70 family RNA polymerase sigma factor [Muribaculaceae bacterium]